jgi:short-subunit dehydrogenase
VKVSVVCPGFVQSAIFESGMYVGSTKENALALIPVRFVPADQAARIILDGVARNRAVIVLPFYAKLTAWITRFAPWLTGWLHRTTVRAFRRRRAKASEVRRG